MLKTKKSEKMSHIRRYKRMWCVKSVMECEKLCFWFVFHKILLKLSIFKSLTGVFFSNKERPFKNSEGGFLSKIVLLKILNYLNQNRPIKNSKEGFLNKIVLLKILKVIFVTRIVVLKFLRRVFWTKSFL